MFKIHGDTISENSLDNIYENDFFGLKTTVDGLSNLIDKINTPFTLGIYGPWGSGKTTIMQLLHDNIKKNFDLNVFWFNAWEYETEDNLLLPLLSKLSMAYNVDYSLWNKTKKIATAISIIGSSAILKKATLGIIDLVQVKDSLEDAERISRLYDNWISQIEELKKNFGEIVFKITGGRKPLIIFIDDLDRCLPENVVSIFEKIKHFLSVKNCIFIIGADKDVLKNGIRARYGTSLISGEEYLEKVINLSYSVPSYKNQICDYVLKRIKKSVSDGFYEKNKDNIDGIATLIGSCPIRNPRRINRVINRLMVYLYAKEEKNYILEVVVKLSIIREFFEGVYNKMKMNNNIAYTPPRPEGGVFTKDYLESRNDHDLIDFLLNEDYHSLRFYNGPYGVIVSAFDSSRGAMIERVRAANREDLIHEIECGLAITNKDYFELVDFLFCFN